MYLSSDGYNCAGKCLTVYCMSTNSRAKQCVRFYVCFTVTYYNNSVTVAMFDCNHCLSFELVLIVSAGAARGWSYLIVVGRKLHV